MTVPYKPIDGQIMTDERDGDYVKASDFNISNIEIEKTLVNHYDVLRESQATDTTTDNRLDILEAEMDDVESILSGLGLGINWVESVPTHADLLAITNADDNDAYTVIHDETLNGNTAVWVWLDIPGELSEWKLMFEISFVPIATATNDGLMTKEKFNQVDSNTSRITTAEADINNLETIKADKAYVDAEDDVLQANINLKADKTYVDAQDTALQNNINTKADLVYVNQQDKNLANSITALNTKVSEIAYGASLLQETITIGGTGVVWPITPTLVDMTTAVKPSNYQPLLLERKFTETGVDGDKPYLLFKSAGRYKVLASFKVHHTNANPVTLTIRAFVNDVLAATFTNNMAGATNETFAFSETWDYEKLSDSGIDQVHFDFMASQANVTSGGVRFETVLDVGEGTGAITVPTDDVVSTSSTNYPDGVLQTYINDDLHDLHEGLDARVTTTETNVSALQGKTQHQTADVNGTTFSNGISLTPVDASTPQDVSKHISLNGTYSGISVTAGSQNYVSSGIHTFISDTGVVQGYVKNNVDNPKSLVTKEYVDTKINGGIQNIIVPDHNQGQFYLVFDEPVPVTDLIKIEQVGTFTTGDSDGTVKGVGFRINGVNTGYVGYGYDVWGSPTGSVSVWWNDSDTSAFFLGLSNQDGADCSYHSTLVTNVKEFTATSHSGKSVSNSTWDSPQANINNLYFTVMGAATLAWYDTVLTLYTKSGKQYAHHWQNTAPTGYAEQFQAVDGDN